MHPRRMWRNSQRRHIGVGMGRPGIGSGRGGGSIGGGGAGLGSGRGAGCCCRICCPTTEMRNRSRAAPRPGADLEDEPGNFRGGIGFPARPRGDGIDAPERKTTFNSAGSDSEAAPQILWPAARRADR